MEENPFKGTDVTLRHTPSPKELEEWITWATQQEVRRLLAQTGIELWPTPQGVEDLDDGLLTERISDQ